MKKDCVLCGNHANDSAADFDGIEWALCSACFITVVDMSETTPATEEIDWTLIN